MHINNKKYTHQQSHSECPPKSRSSGCGWKEREILVLSQLKRFGVTTQLSISVIRNPN
jgi:hypothetical protein